MNSITCQSESAYPTRKYGKETLSRDRRVYTGKEDNNKWRITSPIRGSNPRPCPCEGHVITATPIGLLFSLGFFPVKFDFAKSFLHSML